MHRLALALGCFVRDIDERMASSELTEWLAYFKLEPFGAERDNWHAGVIAAAIVNANRRKGSTPISPAAFMYVDKTTTKQSKDAQFLAGLKRRVKRKQ